MSIWIAFMSLGIETDGEWCEYGNEPLGPVIFLQLSASEGGFWALHLVTTPYRTSSTADLQNQLSVAAFWFSQLCD